MKFLALCAGVAVAIFPLQGSAQNVVRAEKPEVEVGDTWTMKNRDGNTGVESSPTTITVTSVTPDTIVTLTDSRIQTTRSRDWNHVETMVGDRVTSASRPVWMFYQFPLEVGKKWEAQWETVTEQQVTRWSGKSQVEGIEMITVPAGTFQAFKVKFDGTYNGTRKLAAGTRNPTFAGSRRETAWYAPDVRRVVKTEWEERSGTYYNKQVNELMSFKLVP